MPTPGHTLRRRRHTLTTQQTRHRGRRRHRTPTRPPNTRPKPASIQTPAARRILTPNQLARHLPDQNRGILLRQPSHRLIQPPLARPGQRARLIARIANAPDDPQQIEPDDGFFVVQLVHGAGEDVRLGEGGGDGRADAEQFLEGLEQVFEGVGGDVRVGEAVGYCAREGEGEEVLLDAGGFFVEPGDGGE